MIEWSTWQMGFGGVGCWVDGPKFKGVGYKVLLEVHTTAGVFELLFDIYKKSNNVIVDCRQFVNFKSKLKSILFL